MSQMSMSCLKPVTVIYFSLISSNVVSGHKLNPFPQMFMDSVPDKEVVLYIKVASRLQG